MYFSKRLIILAAVLALLTWLLYRGVVKGKRKESFKNIALSLYSLSFVLILLEGVFFFVCRTSLTYYPLASQNWFRRYWHTNSLGYRDFEPTSSDKKSILLVGDSFAAGYGTKNVEDRFSSVLAGKLQNYKVYNLGVSGADTRAEFKNLLEYPISPDLIILQYVGNDIDGVLRANIPFPIHRQTKQMPALEKFIIENSYLLNYIYWQLPHGIIKPLTDYFLNGYNDPEMMKQHLQDLEKFIAYSRESNVPLVVVLFPYLNDLELSKVYYPEIKNFFEDQQVPVVDVADLVKNMDKGDRIVNRSDAHPSVEVHKIVGEELWEVLKSNNLIPAEIPD